MNTKSFKQLFKKSNIVAPLTETVKTTKAITLKAKSSFGRLVKKITRKSTKSHITTQVVEESIIETDSIKIEIESIELEIESVIDVAAEQAELIWNNDTTVYHNMDRVVEWIGNGSEMSNAILKAYFAHFNFSDLKLEQAFRNLCLKLSLKGETQQIDRVLYEFSARYFECNPKCIYSNVDVVHIIVYSIVLLNTDLHVAQGDYKRMTRSEFVNNTMSAIQSVSDFPTLMTESRISFQSIDWAPLQRTASQSSTQSSIYAQSLDTAMDSSFGSKQWQLEVKKMLKSMHTSIRQNQIGDASTPAASIRSAKSISIAIKRGMGF